MHSTVLLSDPMKQLAGPVSLSRAFLRQVQTMALCDVLLIANMGSSLVPHMAAQRAVVGPPEQS